MEFLSGNSETILIWKLERELFKQETSPKNNVFDKKSLTIYGVNVECFGGRLLRCPVKYFCINGHETFAHFFFTAERTYFRQRVKAWPRHYACWLKEPQIRGDSTACIGTQLACHWLSVAA
jgi:hypothetical protein